MAKDNVRSWDATAGNNTDMGGISLAENVMAPPAVNDAFRESMSQIAEMLDEMGYPTSGGTANALTLTPATAVTAYASGDVWTLKAASSNTGAATLNISGVGAKAIRKIVGGTDVALAANDIQAGVRYGLVYDSTANSAAGAFIVASGSGQSQIMGAAIASAGSIDLGAASGSTVHITGTTTITSLGTAAAGAEKNVIFDGVLTLTHNATSLILPGGANITTAAGDTAIVVSEGSGNWRCLAYQRASASPYLSGSTTPTVTPDTGSITTSSCALEYTKIGRQVMWSAIVTITSAGTGAGAINVPLPFTAAAPASAAVREVGSTGVSGAASIASGASTCRVVRYDNASLIVTGYIVFVSGTYSV